MFIVIIYRGLETIEILIISYINSMAYIQHKIDNILCDVQVWAQTYISDIVYNAKLLLDLLQKLRILFDIFFKYTIISLLSQSTLI